MPRKPRWGCLLFFVFMLLWHAALCEEEICCLYRLRPRISSADDLQKDGSIRIGSLHERTNTAQLLLGPEARSAAGDEASLLDLLHVQHGIVLRATWRIKVMNPSSQEENFLLWPLGNRDGILQRRATEGWNLWDVTPLVQEMVQKGGEISFRLQAQSDIGTSGAVFDLSQSWIYVAVSLPDAAPEDYRITDSALLDAAFSALPENHWVLSRYRELTGSLVQAKWPDTGVPYYYGGHSESKVLHPYSPSQPSKYYKSDRTYLNGFDCGSFLHWVEETAGYIPHEQLSEVIKDQAKLFPAPEKSVNEWMRIFLPGDLLVIDHGTWHAGMIIGTPRMYGLTAENAPELADWLDAPMMIHCGEDPFVSDRFSAYIETLSYRMKITPPDGGVTVSLLVNTPEDAPHQIMAPWKKEYGYFEVLGQQMTAYPLSICKRLAWVQPVRDDMDNAFLVEDE